MNIIPTVEDIPMLFVYLIFAIIGLAMTIITSDLRKHSDSTKK